MPGPVPWEALDPCQRWTAGQPVLLRTEARDHLCWVRLTGSNFSPRWLAPLSSMEQRRVHPRELTTRDPRVVWESVFELQVAIAMLSGSAGDSRCAWLAGPYDSAEEADLEALYALALDELAPRQQPLHPQPLPSWTGGKPAI